MSQLTIKSSAENQTVQEKAIAHINISSGAEIVDKDELQEGTMNTEKPPLSEKGLFYQEMIGILNEVHEKTDYSGKNVLMLQERPSLNEDVINSCQLSVQMMGNVLDGLTGLDLTNEEVSLLQRTHSDMLATLSESTPVKLTESNSTKILPDKDICEQLKTLMDNANKHYLKVYEYAVQAQTEYWKQFCDIQGKLSDYVRVNGDKIHFDAPGFLNEILKLYPPKALVEEQFSNKDDAVMWAQEFGAAQVIEVKENGKVVGYKVVVDYTPVDSIVDVLKGMKSEDIGTSKYQAWLTGFTNETENIKTNNQTLTTKYSSANSLYSSLIKLLTSSITTLFDSCKEYMRW